METTAKEIMSTEILAGTPETSLEEALKILVNNRITGFPVVDGEGKMIGICSEYDILVQLAEGKDFKPEAFQEKIKFTTGGEVIPEGIPLDEIVSKFIGSKFRRLPVVNKTGKLVGIITRRDLMRLFYYRARLT